MIIVVDYDAGNIKSIVNMLRVIGVQSRVSSDPADIAEADRLILPGVGHFDHGMKRLRATGLFDALNERVVVRKAPILGICLGAQLLTRGSEEGDQPGFGWIAGETKRFDVDRMQERLPVPHIGWSDCWPLRDNPLLDEPTNEQRFYFVHSFHLVVDNPKDAVLGASYGYDFVAGIARGTILGVQFHPEKSHRFGMAVLRAFTNWTPIS